MQGTASLAAARRARRRRSPFVAVVALATLAALAALASCGGPGVTSVAIEGGDRLIAVGDQAALVAVVTGGPASVTWTSTVPSVATVDAAGVVVGQAAGTTTVRAASNAAPSVQDQVLVTVVPPGETRWTRQLGTGGDDRVYAAAIGADGDAYVAGATSGALAGTNAGGADAYVRRYADDGATVRWTRQFGTAGDEFANGLAAGANGIVVVTGSTDGALAGPNQGAEDVFVRAYDGAGTVVWTRQFGTALGDVGYGAATLPDGRVVVVGSTTGVLEGPGFGLVDGFVRMFEPDGDLQWTRQFGTPASDYALDVAAGDDGRVWVAGNTMGDLAAANAGGVDAYLLAFDDAGDLVWARQFGTVATDTAVGGVALDGLGRVYVAGATGGALEGPHQGSGDAYVRAYDVDGAFLWGAQFGTPANEQVGQVAADGSGYVFVVGETDGALAGPNQGLGDVFVRKLGAGGAVRWTRQFGTPDADSGTAGACDGRVAVAGHTRGDLAAPNAGSQDGFVRVIGP